MGRDGNSASPKLPVHGGRAWRDRGPSLSRVLTVLLVRASLFLSLFSLNISGSFKGSPFDVAPGPPQRVPGVTSGPRSLRWVAG